MMRTGRASLDGHERALIHDATLPAGLIYKIVTATLHDMISEIDQEKGPDSDIQVIQLASAMRRVIQALQVHTL